VKNILLARENVTLTVPQKLEIGSRLESGESHDEVMASCTIGLKMQKDCYNCFWCHMEV
jgi:hypothetical protein